MRTRRLDSREVDREDPRHVPDSRREDAIPALLRGAGNQAVQRLLAARDVERLPVSHGSARLLQRWTPSGAERQQLATATTRLAELQKEYDDDKAIILDALEARGRFNDALEYLHKMDLGYISEALAAADTFFKDAKELARQAITSKKSFAAFLRQLNGYDKTGGRNAVKNAIRDLEGKLKTKQRDQLTQVTKLDEEAFKRYRAGSQPPVRVYRGNGIGVTATSLDNFQPSTIPAGGTPDVSFFGVLQHTHTNTFKNGMVSTTSSKDVAHFWATSAHTYGIVYEFELDDYIHVANLLKKRNFKDRYPEQYEIMAPDAIPASKFISATLYNKATVVKTVSI